MWCLPLFLGLKQLGVLRVPLETESRGLDVTEHSGEIAYHLSDSEDADTSGRVSIPKDSLLDANRLLLLDRLDCKDQQQLAISICGRIYVQLSL